MTWNSRQRSCTCSGRRGRSTRRGRASPGRKEGRRGRVSGSRPLVARFRHVGSRVDTPVAEHALFHPAPPIISPKHPFKSDPRLVRPAVLGGSSAVAVHFEGIGALSLHLKRTPVCPRIRSPKHAHSGSKARSKGADRSLRLPTPRSIDPSRTSVRSLRIRTTTLTCSWAEI